MECLGIHRHDSTVYEGSLQYGFRSNPAPLLLPCAFADSEHQNSVLTQTYKEPVENYPPLLFREDSFEPVTKVRRGRVFSLRNCGQPMQWPVQDPMRSDLDRLCNAVGSQYVTAIFYERANLQMLSDRSRGSSEVFVTLGSEPFLTLWKLIAIEQSVHGTPLLSLRAHRFLDVLPDLVHDSIPAEIRSDLRQALEKIENSRTHLGAVDLVDRCRDALSVIFGHYCGDRSIDLADSIVKFEKSPAKPQKLMCWAGQMVARLHSRAKPNEAFKHGTRPVSESDAELAVACVGLVLRETSWAKSN